MNYSLTQTGNLTAFIGVLYIILQKIGIDVGQSELEQVAGAVVVIVGIITSWVGRYRKGDLTISGFRKK